MSLSRFCRWSLAALPVFFVFTACDQLLPPPAGGTGKLVPVKIRSVSVKGYGEVSATRSAGGERRIVGQPIVQDLGDGMLAEITVEEDVSALRAGDKSLDDKVQFRVIAVDSNNKVYSYADYESNKQKQSYDLINNTNLHVLKDVDYDYIFISYNNSILPPAPKEGDDLSNVTIAVTAGSNDLLWQTISNPEIVNGVPELKFNDIKHKLARVTLVLNASTGRKIMSVVAGSITLNAASSGSFKLTNGTFVSSSSTTNFSGWGTFGQQKVTSNTSTFLESAAAYTFSFAENAVTLSENSTEKQTTAGSVTSDDFTFKANTSYTVTLRILRKNSNKFAVSNIYWDGQKLTFELHGSNPQNGQEKYQGVFFKWGSLVGISPARLSGSSDFNSGTTTNKGQDDGTSIYMKVNGEWKKTNVAYATADDPKWLDWWRAVPDNTTDSAAWNAIPSYYNVSITSPVGDDAYSLLAKSDFEHYKGDICNYINPAYRMPTMNELVALYNSNYESYYEGFTSSDITTQTANGTTAFTDQYGTFTGIPGSTYYLPASGYRHNSSGTLNFVGNYVYYWGGSAHSGTSFACYLYFYSSGGANTSGAVRSLGFPVRCVLN